MKQVEQYRWSIVWAGKRTTTRYHCTEEEIRVEHPEAQPLEGSRRVLHVPETHDEVAGRIQRLSTSTFQKHGKAAT
jgi:hypothetical protein